MLLDCFQPLLMLFIKGSLNLLVELVSNPLIHLDITDTSLDIGFTVTINHQKQVTNQEFIDYSIYNSFLQKNNLTHIPL